MKTVIVNALYVETIMVMVFAMEQQEHRLSVGGC